MKLMKVKAFLLALPLLITACTGGNGGNNNRSSAASGDNGPITIKFWHTFGQTVVDGLKSKINDFKKLVKENDGVDVDVDLKYQGDYDDIAKLIADGYAVFNSPTMAVAYPDNVSDYLDIGKSANQEFVVNLDKFISSDTVGFGKEKWLGDEYDEEDFVEDFYAEGSQYSVEGTYSLPFLKSTEIMFYNMDLLIEVMKGFKPDLNNSETLIKDYMSKISWDEFMELCAYAQVIPLKCLCGTTVMLTTSLQRCSKIKSHILLLVRMGKAKSTLKAVKPLTVLSTY